MFTQDKES